jgi:4'-phosphopantetheinyl transferase
MLLNPYVTLNDFAGWFGLGEAIAVPSNGEVHVWLVSSKQNVEKVEEILSSDELQRLWQFVSDKARRSYFVGRVALRLLLSKYLELDPGKIGFVYGANGKPRMIAAPGDTARLAFNLSHTADLIVIAVSTAPVGIDVERIDVEINYEALQHHVMTECEKRNLSKYQEEHKREEFIRCWTRKEAILKLWGVGLTGPLTAIETGDVSSPLGKKLITFNPCIDHIASLACSVPVRSLKVNWSGSLAHAETKALHGSGGPESNVGI